MTTYDYNHEAQAIRDAYGIHVSVVDTSGGNYVLTGLLETGHHLVVGDPADSLSTSAYRGELADDGVTVGYGVAIHLPTDDGSMFGDCVAAVSDDDAASPADLVALIERALADVTRR